jgi:hypothetical protein
MTPEKIQPPDLTAPPPPDPPPAVEARPAAPGVVVDVLPCYPVGQFVIAAGGA